MNLLPGEILDHHNILFLSVTCVLVVSVSTDPDRTDADAVISW